MQEKYGFVYIWRDRKHKRYYIGAHWGTTDDRYICSSTWMKRAYYRRPHDFKRRILKTNIQTRKYMFDIENQYLNLIEDNEFGKKYYNLQKRWEHWSYDEEKLKTVSEKLKNRKLSEKQKNHLSNINLGKVCSEETKQKISIANKGRKFSTSGTKDKIWISRDNEIKIIHKNDQIPDGWIKRRSRKLYKLLGKEGENYLKNEQRTEEQRRSSENHSRRMKNNIPWNKGKPNSQQNKGEKTIIINNIEFKSYSEAAKIFNKHVASFTQAVKKYNTNIFYINKHNKLKVYHG